MKRKVVTGSKFKIPRILEISLPFLMLPIPLSITSLVFAFLSINIYL